MQRVQPFTLLNPVTSVSSHIIYKHQWLGSTEPHVHAIILPAIWSWTLSLLLHTFLFPSGTSSSLFHLPNSAGCVRCFLAQSNQAFLGLSVTFCLDLVVNPLYLQLWRHLLIVDLENDVRTYTRLFFNWNNSLQTLAGQCIHSFLTKYQTIDLVASKVFLFDRFILVFQPNTALLHLHWHLFGCLIESSSEQLTKNLMIHLESAPDLWIA